MTHSAVEHTRGIFFHYGNETLFGEFVWTLLQKLPQMCCTFLHCFAFTFCSVHPKPAPQGFSLETVLVFSYAKPRCSSFLLMFWVIIMLSDEPLSNRSIILSYLSLSHHSDAKVQYHFLQYSVVLLMHQ